MKISFLLSAILILGSLTACSQPIPQQHIGGPCEGCEAIYEQSPPFDQLKAVDTLPDFNEAGPRIEISGIVYQRDGKTPAPDVVMYVYHTDQGGRYTAKEGQSGWAKRHGYIRGWIKTDKNGYYQFFTLRPAHYPERSEAAHIHVTVKEPGKNEYWLSEYLFEDDSLLTLPKRKLYQYRGGDGIIKLVPPENGISHGTRHIILGLNVPGYPYAGLPKIKSGLPVGAVCPAFEPLHLSGADKGRHTCPMCTYGSGQGIMVWFNHTNLDQLKRFLQLMEKEMEKRSTTNFRVFMVYMNPAYKSSTDTGQQILGRKIIAWCEAQHIKKVAMVWVPSPVDVPTCGVYKINPEAKNTVFAYKKRKIVDKWVNIEYADEAAYAILKKLDATAIKTFH